MVEYELLELVIDLCKPALLQDTDLFVQFIEDNLELSM